MYYDFQKVTLITKKSLFMGNSMRYIDMFARVQGSRDVTSTIYYITVMSREKGHSKGVSKRRINDKTPQHIFLLPAITPSIFVSISNQPPPSKIKRHSNWTTQKQYHCVPCHIKITIFRQPLALE